MNNKYIEYSVSKEVINLWIEVTYLRLLLSYVLKLQINQNDIDFEDLFKNCNDEAIKIVGKKFGVIQQIQEPKD